MIRPLTHSVSIGFSLAALAIGAVPGFAQVQVPQSAAQESVWGQQQSIDPLSGGSGGFMELMRRLNRGTVDYGQMQRQQTEGLVNAADAFRLRQQELLKARPIVPTAPGVIVVPSTGVPVAPVAAPVVPVAAPAPAAR
jgi:hypothetical protein